MKFVIIVWLTLTCMIACKKENIDYFITDPGNIANDTSWKDEIAKDAPIVKLKESLAKPYITATLDASLGGTVKIDDKLQLQFAPNSFTRGDNKSVGGIVNVSVALMQNKGDMILFSKPTTSRALLLESAASFDVRVKQNEAELSLVPYKQFTINYTNVQAKEGMLIYYGTTDLINDFNFDWVAATDSSYVSVWKDSSGSTKGYQLFARALGWLNCDKPFYPASNALATISVLMPLNFTNNNTVVYAVSNDRNTVVGLKGDAAHKIFTTDNLPAGSNITLVSISRLGNDYYLGTQTITATNLQRVSLNPAQKTLQQITTYLSTL